MKRVATTKVVVDPTSADPNMPSNLEASKYLSVDVNIVAASVSIPLEFLKGIWQKAEKLLNSPHAIGMSSAPGQPEETRMVLSCSGKRPRLVLPCKGGRFKCDSVLILNIWAYALAV